MDGNVDPATGTLREQHNVPVIERMMELLEQLETAREGLRIGELVGACRMPRSTVYRIMNTLERHEVVRRDEEGRYRLGSRLLQFAANLPGDPRWTEVAAVAMPHLREFSRRLGETSKVSVRDGREALCITGVQGSLDFALSLSIGKRYPLHAGAASKMLLANMPEATRKQILSGGLAAMTANTVTSRDELAAELAQIRRQGWAEDRGEYVRSVGALAAPVRWSGGEVLAAVSVAFLAATEPPRKQLLREAVMATADAISAACAERPRAG